MSNFMLLLLDKIIFIICLSKCSIGALLLEQRPSNGHPSTFPTTITTSMNNIYVPTTLLYSNTQQSAANYQDKLINLKNIEASWIRGLKKQNKIYDLSTEDKNLRIRPRTNLLAKKPISDIDFNIIEKGDIISNQIGGIDNTESTSSLSFNIDSASSELKNLDNSYLEALNDDRLASYIEANNEKNSIQVGDNESRKHYNNNNFQSGPIYGYQVGPKVNPFGHINKSKLPNAFNNNNNNNHVHLNHNHLGHVETQPSYNYNNNNNLAHHSQQQQSNNPAHHNSLNANGQGSLQFSQHHFNSVGSASSSMGLNNGAAARQPSSMVDMMKYSQVAQHAVGQQQAPLPAHYHADLAATQQQQATHGPPIMAPIDLSGTSVCGRQQVHYREPRVVGGNTTYEGEFPWAVSIQRHGNHHCGGVIVGRRWILTAAHCVRSQLVVNLIVRTGGHTLSRSANNINSHLERDYTVDQIIMHKDFSKHDNLTTTLASAAVGSQQQQQQHQQQHQQQQQQHLKPSVNANNADIALLKLRYDIQWSEMAWPVCFPNKEAGNFSGHDAIVIGWGKLNEKSDDFSNELQKVKLTIIDNKQCQNWFRQAGRDMLIDDRLICAGFKNGGKDACHGDSGGPLLSKINGQFVVVGVVSTGIGCARPLLPGLYSRVSSYMDWIESYVA